MKEIGFIDGTSATSVLYQFHTICNPTVFLRQKSQVTEQLSLPDCRIFIPTICDCHLLLLLSNLSVKLDLQYFLFQNLKGPSQNSEYRKKFFSTVNWRSTLLHASASHSLQRKFNYFSSAQ